MQKDFSKLDVGETFSDLHLLVMAVHCEVPPGLGGDTELAGDGLPHQEARHCHRHQGQRHPLARPHFPSLTCQFPLSSSSPVHSVPLSLGITFMNMVFTTTSIFIMTEVRIRDYGKIGDME